MKDYKYAYLIGIGGIGMSALARWFHAQQIQVFGYDRAATGLTDQLTQEGIRIHFEAQIAAIPREILCNKDQSLVVYTSAIASHQPILSYLKTNHYTVCKRAAILGMVTQRYLTLAVAGTHGKTTTSSLAAHVLYQAGKNITAFLGGIAKGYGANLVMRGKENKDRIVVVEADEFDRLFLHLHPTIAIVTTVDPDHLDTYGNVQGFEQSFKEFIQKVPKQKGKAIVHQAVAKKLWADADVPKVIQYDLTGTAVRAENIHISQGNFCFDYVSEEVTIQDIRLSVPGYHNVENAVAVITACLCIGLTPATIREGIATFQGVKRRFDRIIQREDLVLLDDYAHHPVEVATLLRTIRQVYPGKAVTAVFRPNLYTRTKDFAEEFAQSLDLADRVFLLDIYPDREESIQGVTSALIFDQMKLEQKCLCHHNDLMKHLAMYGKPDVVVNMGSGGTSWFVPPIKNFLLKHWGSSGNV